MIIPSIDIQGAQTVQLIGGREKALEAGDPVPIIKQFRLAGEVAVIDLDAAMGTGDNKALIKGLLPLADCRVGGGIRSLDAAINWLDSGASKIILGTKATPEILSQLPKDRLIAALDAYDGEVVVDGWQTRTGQRVEDKIAELKQYVNGIMITFVEREGRLGGIDIERVKHLVSLCSGVKLTIAGGVTTTDEIAALHSLEVDAQVGMALYTGKFHLAEAIVAPITSSAGSEGSTMLIPTVVCDERGQALGLAWSNSASLKEAVTSQRGVYHSRKRGLWKKGDSSGNHQDLLRIDLDCDNDTLRFIVKQHGVGFCHNGTYTCWGNDMNALSNLQRLITHRQQTAPEGSYTARLFGEEKLLKAKLLEEASELAEAVSPADHNWEAADLLYFAMVALADGGGSLAEVEAILSHRARKITRRPGNSKA